MVQTKTYTTREQDFDFEVESEEKFTVEESEKKHSFLYYVRFLVVGILFGIVLVKGEVISWFRIQEMFRFQSFHMYGVIGSAVVVGIISVWMVKRFQLKSIDRDSISFPAKHFHKGQIFGGLLFGFGWALTGACPGPLFAQIGAGFSVVIAGLLSAIAGTWVYGVLRDKLPH
jgi:uncharacterized membrane protein YedE/YeeE